MAETPGETCQGRGELGGCMQGVGQQERAKEGLAEEVSETTETKAFIRSQGDSSGIKLSYYPRGNDTG